MMLVPSLRTTFKTVTTHFTSVIGKQAADYGSSPLVSASFVGVPDHYSGVIPPLWGNC